MAKTNLKKPLVISLAFGLSFFIISYFFRIPMLDGTVNYSKELVNITLEQKLGIYDLFNSSDKLVREGMLPTKVELKTIGKLLFVLIYIGFPVLVFLRIYFHQEKKRFEK